MKVKQNAAAVGLTAAGVALVLAVSGCGSSDDSSSDSSSSASSSAASATTSSASSQAPTSAPAAAADYNALLIKASDIPDVGEPFIAEPPIPSPNDFQGVAQLFHTADDSARIGITIIVLADPAAAAKKSTEHIESLSVQVTGTPQPWSVDSNGTVVSGTKADGSRAVTMLTFTVENVLATIEFDSAPGDLNPVPADFVDSVGAKQLDVIKAELPKVAQPR